jgi:hypothetical protein
MQGREICLANQFQQFRRGKMRYYLLISIILFQIACSSFAQETKTDESRTKAQRKSFQKRNLVLKSPDIYLKRELANGTEYDPKPTIKLVDEKSGKYEFSWIGYDKKKKIVIYNREDAIDAVVEARVEKTSGGKFLYKYLIKNMPESPTFLHGFTVQTISADVKSIELDDVFIGEMSNYIKEYKEGSWKDFAVSGDNSSRITEGKSIEFSLVSSALPGIVGCRVSGGIGYTIGVGEHLPQELDNLVPVNLSAKGSTIGPIDRLATLTKSERAKYLVDNLPKFQEVGWITGDAAKKYVAILKKEDLAGAWEQAKKDIESEIITSEVYHIIEGLNQ